MDYSILQNNIEQLSSQKGISPTKAFEESGVGKNFFLEYKKRLGTLNRKVPSPSSIFRRVAGLPCREHRCPGGQPCRGNPTDGSCEGDRCASSRQAGDDFEAGRWPCGAEQQVTASLTVDNCSAVSLFRLFRRTNIFMWTPPVNVCVHIIAQSWTQIKAFCDTVSKKSKYTCNNPTDYCKYS